MFRSRAQPMTASTTPRTPTASTVPLAIWPVAQTTAQWQRAGRYLPACTAHPGKMLPELARRIITEYSSPGALIVDPLAGIGTTIVEAALLDRRAVGVELEARWAAVAEENLDHMLDSDRRALAEVCQGDARRLPELLGGLAGTSTSSSPHRRMRVTPGSSTSRRGGGRAAVPARQPQLLDRPGQARPRPRDRLRRSHGRDLHRLPRCASSWRPAGGGHQEHPS